MRRKLLFRISKSAARRVDWLLDCVFPSESGLKKQKEIASFRKFACSGSGAAEGGGGGGGGSALTVEEVRHHDIFFPPPVQLVPRITKRRPDE